MMRGARPRAPPAPSAFVNDRPKPAAGAGEEWEVRPCGMLVQKRDPSAAPAAAPAPTIRVRVKFGQAYHEIYISSQATFGELKKKLSAATGLHHLDQKVLFKDRERDSAAYLDVAGVKDRSKLVVLEDSTAKTKRLLEMRREAKMEKAAKSISQISLEVDKLASKVSALEEIVSKGKKVAENDVLNLIELLMSELIKLDGIIADGDVKLQRGMQVRRVQKYVETLDVIKVKNSTPKPPPPPPANANGQKPVHQQQTQPKKQQPPPPPSPVVVTTKWETFDSLFSPSSSSAAAAAAAAKATPTPRFDWELF